MGERCDGRERVKALGNAERLRVLAYLRNVGEATVGEVAAALSMAPGSASYHIGRLADGGLVERAVHEGGDGRKSWWRAVGRESLVDASEEAPFFSAANRAYGDAYERYLGEKPRLEQGWVESEAGADAVLSLSAEEAAELKEELEAFVRRWAERAAERSADRTDVRPVALVARAFRWVP